MPKPNYNGNNNNTYASMYEQYYINNTAQKNEKPIRRNIKKKKRKESDLVNKLIVFFLSLILLFYVLPYSYNKFIGSALPPNSKKLLKIDYYKLLYPTHTYLYKDLFLGRYILKDTKYKKHLMVDIKESSERNGLKTRLLSLAQNYRRIKPAVYVWEQNGSTYVDIDADKPFPAASIIKIPILIEMFREIESGKFSLYDTMVLEDYYRASGSGKLQYSQGGVAHSMDYLAQIMIQNSDNSSTNMIMSKIGGMPEINRALNRWGLKTTHINNWLPDLSGTNITTARELAKMLYNVDSTNILTNESKRQIAKYMGHVKNNRLLQAGIPSDAVLLHKTGDIGFMVGDAGIVKTANGKKYIVVILVRRPYNHLSGKEFIVKASQIIYNNISYN